jgi:rsbT antagonist protein RsbS
VARVPIVRVGDTLIATVQEDLRDADAMELQEQLTERLEKTGASGVLLDLSVIETVDSFLGRLIHDIASISRLLGAQTVIAGVQPAVAVTLVELGLDLQGVATALNAEQGLSRVRKLVAQEQQRAKRSR